MNAISLLLVEDNAGLRTALKSGLEATGDVRVAFDCASGEEALEYSLTAARECETAETAGQAPVQAAILDVQLAGELNGIRTAAALRREFPRFPVVFYSIQDDDAYYRDFRLSGILSHYAYLRKSNFLLPAMILPPLRDAIAGRGFIDPDVEARVEEVRRKDENDPMAMLEPSEQAVARMLAQGLTNEQIAARMGFRDKRTISRTNGQIYAAWGLTESTTDEKIARTRAALIVRRGTLISWDGAGRPRILDAKGEWIPLPEES